MRLYSTPLGTWAGTQADARALAKSQGTTWEEREVPVDKAGLLTFLNANVVGGKAAQACPVPTPVRRPIAAMDASAVLSRIDNPGTDVDAVVETIAHAKGHALKRYAAAVALAFEGLFKDVP